MIQKIEIIIENKDNRFDIIKKIDDLLNQYGQQHFIIVSEHINYQGEYEKQNNNIVLKEVKI